MLYISGSSGAQFDERARQMRNADSVIEAISTGGARQSEGF